MIILTGEITAMIIRFSNKAIKGSINDESSVEESFGNGLLEYHNRPYLENMMEILFLMFYFVVIMKSLENGA